MHDPVMSTADRIPEPAPAPTAAAGAPTSPSLWRLADYRAWFTADTLGDLGSSLRAFALPLISYAVTDSLTAAGAVGTVGSFSANLALIPAGVLVDRLPRKELLIACSAAKALVWAAAAAAWWAGRLTLPVLIVVAVLSGVTAAVAGLASNAMMKHIVPDGRYGSAQAANQAREAAFQMAVNPLGGWLMTLATGAPLLAEAIGQGLAAVVLGRVSADTRPTADAAGGRDSDGAAGDTPDGTREGRAADLRRMVRESTDGFRWIGAHGLVIRIALAFCLLSMALTAVTTCLTLSWAREGLSTSRIGILTAPAGIGMLLGAAAAPWLLERIRSGALLLASGAVEIAALAAMAAVRDPLARSCCLLLLCLAIPTLNAVGSGYTMRLIPTDVIGRVSSALQLVNIGPVALAPLLATTALEVLGPSGALATATAIAAAGVLVLGASKQLRGLGLPADW